ncbi:MAG TPA: ribosome maturation factor RimP [Bryobacteraceae bacterium]|jgi:ribosome maturation factor RimP|nr:ribosome maturation factor RimP [Bryobacteraceae bacterium]
MATAEKAEILDRITELGERAAAGTPVEIVEIELKGSGKARLLRVYIDKPGGVTHGDCELISERLGKLLDEGDVIPGDSYTLEVSSPGLERRLTRPRDFERVLGQNVKVVLREPLEGQNRWEGKLEQVADDAIELAVPGGNRLRIPLTQLQKANLKFEW